MTAAGERLAETVAASWQDRNDHADNVNDAKCVAELRLLRALAMLPQSTTTLHLSRALLQVMAEDGAA